MSHISSVRSSTPLSNCKSNLIIYIPSELVESDFFQTVLKTNSKSGSLINCINLPVLK